MFTQVNQLRLSLKMNLHRFSWYSRSLVDIDKGEYIISVYVRQLNDKVKKLVPHSIKGIKVKTEVEF